MKEYIKPEIDLVIFESEEITIGTGTGQTGSNNFGEGDIVIP